MSWMTRAGIDEHATPTPDDQNHRPHHESNPDGSIAPESVDNGGVVGTPDDSELRQRFHDIAKSYYGYVSGNTPSFDKPMWGAMVNQMLDAAAQERRRYGLEQRIAELDNVLNGHAVLTDCYGHLEARKLSLQAELTSLEAKGTGGED